MTAQWSSVLALLLCAAAVALAQQRKRPSSRGHSYNSDDFGGPGGYYPAERLKENLLGVPFKDGAPFAPRNAFGVPDYVDGSDYEDGPPADPSALSSFEPPSEEAVRKGLPYKDRLYKQRGSGEDNRSAPRSREADSRSAEYSSQIPEVSYQSQQQSPRSQEASYPSRSREQQQRPRSQEASYPSRSREQQQSPRRQEASYASASREQQPQNPRRQQQQSAPTSRETTVEYDYPESQEVDSRRPPPPSRPTTEYYRERLPPPTQPAHHRARVTKHGGFFTHAPPARHGPKPRPLGPSYRQPDPVIASTVPVVAKHQRPVPSLKPLRVRPATPPVAKTKQ